MFDLNDVSISVLELLGMAVSAWVLVMPREDLPTQAGERVKLRGRKRGSSALGAKVSAGVKSRGPER